MKKRMTDWRVAISLFCLLFVLLSLICSPYSVLADTEAGETEETTETEATTDPSSNDDPLGSSVTCTQCAVVNADNGIIMYAKGPTDRIAPASTVKLLSGILAFEYYHDRMNESITVTSASLSASGGFSIHLKDGEVVSAGDLLRAMIISNANDAASVLAYNIGDNNVSNFVRMMNEKATELGCTDSFFTNPTGMDDDQMYTTVTDLAKIVSYCAQNTEYTALTTVDSYIIPATNLSQEREISNRNHMVSTDVYQTKYYNPLAKGLVAGATEKGGKCCVELFTWYGHNYAAIVMNAKYDQEQDFDYMYTDAETLLQWGFDNYTYLTIADTKTMICELPVTLSHNGDHVALVPARSVEIFVPKTADPDSDVEISWRLFADEIQAPVAQGAIAGFLTVKYQGTVLDTIELVTKTDMSVSTFLRFANTLKQIVTNGFFIAFVCLLLVAAILTVWYTAKRRGAIIAKHKKRSNTKS